MKVKLEGRLEIEEINVKERDKMAKKRRRSRREKADGEDEPRKKKMEGYLA